LLPENEDVWELWVSVLTQWRSGPNGVIGLDYSTVAMIAEVTEITFDKVTLRKLRVLEGCVLQGIYGKQKGQAANDPKSAFCRACRTAKRNLDCSTCNVDGISTESGKV
jgi:hypothetical protein